MAIRRRQVHPDQIYRLRDREIPVVSDEAYLEALLEVGRHQCFAGGTINGTVLRHPTDLDGEMVTVGAVIEWKDRTDAKPQPEPASPAPSLPPQEPEEDTLRDAIDRGASLHPGDVPDFVRNGEPYDLRVEGGSLSADAALERVDRAVAAGPPAQGRGSAALPFQRDAAPAAPVDGRIESGELVGLSTAPDPPQVEVPAIASRIAHGDTEYRPVGPVPGVADEEVQDGLVVVDTDVVDDSEVPEHLRD